MDAFNKIFIQSGVVSDNRGWGDLVRNCNALTIPVFIATSDANPPDVQANAINRANWISTDQNIQVPSWQLAPDQFDTYAVEHWNLVESKMPPEMDKSIVTISTWNEPGRRLGWGSDTPPPESHLYTGWMDYLGELAVAVGQEAVRRGYRWAAFGFAGGMPDEGTWDQPGMVAYLQLCNQHPDLLGIAVHEYCQADFDFKDRPDEIGRFKHIYDKADELGLKRPFLEIKEFGWTAYWWPATSDRVWSNLNYAAALYAAYPEVKGAAIFTTQAGWGVNQFVTALIPELEQYTLDTRFDGNTVLEILRNGSFEEGWNQNHPYGMEIQVPTNFDVEWSEDPTGYGSESWDVFVKPEVRVLPYDALPENERAEFILDGNYTVKIFKGNGAIKTTLTQTLTSLSGRYRVFVPVFPDLVIGYEGGQKIFASLDPQPGSIRVQVGDLDTGELPIIPGEWNDHVNFEFNANGDTTLIVTFESRYAIMNSGFFTDAWKLTEVETTPKGDARVPYSRIYLRVNQSASRDQWLQAAEYAYENSRLTVGFSNDDAGIGVGLGHKRIIEAFAEFPPDTIESWYQHFYGVTDVQHLWGKLPPSGVISDDSINSRRLGDARVPYARVYYRVNQNATKAQFMSVANLAYNTRSTVGFSNDDAGIGVGLSSKKIIEVGREFDEDVINQWYLDNYGVTNVIHLDYPDSGEAIFQFDSWVANSTRITRLFGTNPEAYEQFGLPGHGGIDVAGNWGDPAYAATAGTVFAIENDADHSAYGKHVRIRHQRADGVFRTIYAHLSSISVNVGQVVEAGQVIGLIGNTGNSTGSHLHLELRKDGATASGETDYPYDIIDPTPFASPFLDDEPPIPPVPSSNPAIGLHLRADPTDVIPAEWGEVEILRNTGRPKIVKFFQNHPLSVLDGAANRLGTDAIYVLRIMFSWGNRDVHPDQFIHDTQYETKNRIDRLMTTWGIPANNIYLEIHNEPNLAVEGWQWSWANGTGFANWLSPVLDYYRRETPVKLMFPGLSPGFATPDRYESHAFLEQAYPVIASKIDAVGVHSYWSDGYPIEGNWYSGLGYIQHVRNIIGNTKPMIVTEASRNDRPASQTPSVYGAEYAQFANLLTAVPAMLGVTYFVSSASNGYFYPETWVREDGSVRGIAEALSRNL